MRENWTVFGHMPDGTPVEELTLRDGALSCRVITYGGALRALSVPDRDGKSVDIVLGFDRLEDYRAQDKYIGALVGRYANRIGGAKFTLNGAEYRLAQNDGKNSLHGGAVGFSHQVWAVEALTDRSVTLSLVSPDGQEGYPGTLEVKATYTLRDGALAIDYRARSDRDTVFNPTNHSYFNLSGQGSGSVEGQFIKLYASRYTPIAAGAIPTGDIAPVEGTPMDLRRGQRIGQRIEDDFGQLKLAGGYDHNWCVDGWDGTLRPAALAWSPATGVVMETLTTLPGVQFYTANFLAGCPKGKGGAAYENRGAFCLETQFYPDTPNRPGFPSCVLRAGEEFRGATVYRFPAPQNAGEIKKEGIPCD